MIVELMESIEADIILGSQLDMYPRWLLDSLAVIIGPYFSGEEYEQHTLDTLGSSDALGISGDGMRFGKTDLLIKSAQFRVPEVHVSLDNIPVIWQKEKALEGLLRLQSPNNFQLSSMDIRWMDPCSGILICATDRALVAGGDRIRLRIAHDFDILFADRMMCGWLLSSPERYLVESWEASLTGKPDRELSLMLYESLELVSEPNIEKMDQEDPDILRALQDLHRRIKCDYGSIEKRRVLHNWIKDIIERFYNKTV